MLVPAIFIIVPDPFSTDAVEFIRPVSTLEPFTSEIIYRDGKQHNLPLAWLRGGIGNSDNISYCYLIAHSGNIRLSYTLEELKNPFSPDKSPCHIVGYILLVDSKKSVFEESNGNKGHRVYSERGKLIGWEWDSPVASRERYFGVEALVRLFNTPEEIAQITPLIVAVVNQHLPDAMPLEEIRKRLPVPDVKLIACEVTDKASVKNVFLELLKDLPENELAETARKAILDN